MEFDSLRHRQRVSTCCKKFAAFLFSQVGLATMVVAYSIMGGFLFRALEAPYEEDLKAAVRDDREEKVEEAWKMLTEQFGNVTVWNKTQFVDELMKIFVHFQDNVAKAVKEKGWDGKDESGEQWSFPGALLYAVTVITTIGYGHIAPKTNLGRFVTILYALVGIPLTFLYLSTIGNFLAHCFRIFYKRICCDICCCLRCERTKRRQLQMLRRQRQIDQYHSDRSEMQLTNVETATSEFNKVSASITTNTIASTYIAIPSGQALTDRYGQDVLTMGGVSPGENWLNIAEPDSGSGRLHSPTTSIQGPRLRTVASGSNIREDRALFSFRSNSSSQGDSKSRKGKKAKNRSRSVEDSIPRTPVRLQSTPTPTKSTESGHSFSLESTADSSEKTGVAKETADLKRNLTTSRLTSVLKRTKVEDKSDKTSEKTPKKRKRLWRSQSVKESTTKSKPEPIVMSENGRERRGEDGIERTAVGGAAENEVPDEGKMQEGRELGVTKGRSTENEKDGEAEEIGNGLKDGVIGHRASASTERNGFFESSLRKSLQEATLNGSEESFVTANEDASLHDDIYQSTSVFDCTTSTRNLSSADSGRSKGSKDGGEATMPSSETQPAASTGQADYQRLAKNNVRIRFAESEFGPECHLDYEDDDEDMKHSKIRVPIYICLIVIMSYILAGSVLFTLWEDWDLLTGSYFCFITLSTIGFGDIVPGTDMDKWDSSEKLVLCALWLALGLSLLAMCFNLMQEEVKEKCKWIAFKCGLIRNETNL